MAQVIIHTDQLTASVFGLSQNLKLYKISKGQIEPSVSDSFVIETIDESELDQQGLLGFPVFDNPEFASMQWTENGEQKSAEGFTLIDAIIDVTLNMDVVRTKVTKRRGTIKEYISADDYSITIKALLSSGKAKVSPENKVRATNALLSAPVSLTVYSKVLEWFGITSISVLGFNVNAVPGYVGLRAVEIRALSDLPIDIETDLELKNA